MWADTKIAGLNAEAAEERSKLTKIEVLRQVASSYYSSLLSKQSLELAYKNLQSADTILAIAKNRFTNQLIDKLEFNRVKNQYIALRNEYEQKRNIYYNNLSSLKYYLGMEQKDSIVFKTADVPITTGLTEANSESVSDYHSVAEKKLRMEAALWNFRKQHLSRLPQVSLYGRYFKQAQRNETDFFNGNKNWFEYGLAGVRVELPLFSGISTPMKIKKARLAYDISKKEYEKQTEKEKLEDKQLYNNLITQKIAVDGLMDAYKNSEENLSLAILKYREGIYGTDQYLNVMQETLAIQMQYLRALSDLYITSANIQLKKQ